MDLKLSLNSAPLPQQNRHIEIRHGGDVCGKNGIY